MKKDERLFAKNDVKRIPFAFEDARKLVGKTIIVEDEQGKCFRLIVEVDKTGIYTWSDFFTFEYIFEHFIFADGEPCGKVVGE